MGLLVDSRFYSGTRALSVIWAQGLSCSWGVFCIVGSEVRSFHKPPERKCWEEVHVEMPRRESVLQARHRCGLWAAGGCLEEAWAEASEQGMMPSVSVCLRQTGKVA